MINQFTGHPPPEGGLAAFGLLGMIIGLLIMIGAIVLLLYIAQYIYKDAVKRNLNAELWLLMVFIVPVLSWIVYFLVRKTGATRASGDLKEIKP